MPKQRDPLDALLRSALREAEFAPKPPRPTKELWVIDGLVELWQGKVFLGVYMKQHQRKGCKHPAMRYMRCKDQTLAGTWKVTLPPLSVHLNPQFREDTPDEIRERFLELLEATCRALPQ